MATRPKSRQTSTYNLYGKRGFESRWKTVALAWFGSFAIFRAVASSNGSTANASGSASAKETRRPKRPRFGVAINVAKNKRGKPT